MLIVRSTMYSSPTTVSSRRWRSMRTAVSLKWQRSVGKVALPCKPSLVPRVPLSGFSFRSRGMQPDVARGVHTGYGVDAVVPKPMYAYAQAFLEQVLVSVACNGAHVLSSGWRVGCL